MEKFVKGDVVVVPFPFSDLSQSKRRPALVIASLEADDIILCQITSKLIRDDFAIVLNDKDFETGGLIKTSNVRPNRIFTADTHIVLYRIGHLKQNKLNQIIEKVMEIIRI